MNHHNPYRNLAVMFVLSFAAMYVLMYAMVDSLQEVYGNLNQAYMAALMAAPMVIIELVVMRSMYPNRVLNSAILGASAVGACLFFGIIRVQTGVSDRQFLRSMIPHHSGAILMCEEASVSDPDIVDLCHQITASQRAEIATMQAKLNALDRSD